MSMNETDLDDRLTARERRALALWRTPEPPADLASRVVARLESERGAGGAARPVAMAALAVALVGGLVALRLLSAAAGSAPGGAGDVRLVGGAGDGGGAAETSPRGDGVGDRIRS
jgi:hypothetical protein